MRPEPTVRLLINFGLLWAVLGEGRVQHRCLHTAAVRLQSRTARRIFRPRRYWHGPAGGDRQYRMATSRRMVVGTRPPRHGDPACRDRHRHPVRLGAPEAAGLALWPVGKAIVPVQNARLGSKLDHRGPHFISNDVRVGRVGSAHGSGDRIDE
jgi:hypothetical protein